MKKMRIVLLAGMLAVLLLPWGAGASQTSGAGLTLEGEQVTLRLPGLSKYTFVTPENLDEHMELCLSRGNSEEDVRRRFATGNLIWEAYREDVDGCFRLEIFEDEWTHYIWDTVTMTDGAFKRLPAELSEGNWLSDRYYLFSMRAEGSLNRGMDGSFIAYPPYEYESGRFRLNVYHGRAYLLTYGDTKPASSSSLWEREHQFEIITDVLWSWFQRDNEELAQSAHPTDLLYGDAGTIFNLHPGTLELKGKTESNATVTLEANGKTVEAQVDEREYKGKVELVEGENVVTLRATKNKRVETVLEQRFVVNSAVAALRLTDYPYGDSDRNKLRVAGYTDPAGAIWVTLDDGEKVNVPVSEKGAFEYSFTASEWDNHVIEIVASQEGLEDCGARFDFWPTYAKADKGYREYLKSLEPDRDLEKYIWKIMDDPEAYIGKHFRTNVRIKKGAENVTYANGYITVEAEIRVKDAERKDVLLPYILVFEDYYEDWPARRGSITVLMEAIEPTLTDPVLPRFRAEFLIYEY